MRSFSVVQAIVILFVAVVFAGTVQFVQTAPDSDPDAITFWEAAGRGLVTATLVNETYDYGGRPVISPVGLRLDNLADVPVVVSEEAVLMSPHPLESPPPELLRTTQDAVVTVQTIPAGGSLLFSYGELVVQDLLPSPAWWCSEEFQITQADISYRIGGETLPFALRPIVANERYGGPDSNRQIDLWTYLRSSATVVIGKEPLWTEVAETEGQRIRVTIDATNIAVYTFEDAMEGDVNVTHGVLEDEVPAGWTVEEGSYSIPPHDIAVHDDGSQSLRWFVDLSAALASDSMDPQYPSMYEPVNRSYTLVSAGLDPGRVVLPRARSDMNADGSPDAHSAAPIVDVVSVGMPEPDAGGPYFGTEGDTLILSASRSTDPEGDSLQFRWDFTGDGMFDTPWSSNPTAEARYTDDFSGVAVVEATDGSHVASADAAVSIANALPEIQGLDAAARAAFRIEIAGEKWHEISLTIDSDSGALASLDLVRRPGSPSAQAAMTDVLTFSLRERVSATLAYTPEDDPVNGRIAGDNPVWIIVILPDGHEARMIHNFNTQHGATWRWEAADLAGFFMKTGVSFRADLHDSGSDDFTATWDFGDGTSATATYFNDGVGPDSPQSQGGTAPFDVSEVLVHAFPTGGAFTVTLTIRDDDGDVAVVTIVLAAP